jgi:hypothetical protein
MKTESLPASPLNTDGREATELVVSRSTDGLAHVYNAKSVRPVCGASTERADDPGCGEDDDVCEACYAAFTEWLKKFRVAN